MVQCSMPRSGAGTEVHRPHPVLSLGQGEGACMDYPGRVTIAGRAFKIKGLPLA